MKKYNITYKIKGERIWCNQCLKHMEIIAKTKKEAKEKAFEKINKYRNTIVSIDIIGE